MVVFWNKGTSALTARNLVALDLSVNGGAITGQGYDKGLYNITPDFSLIINRVKVGDEGRFFCEVSDHPFGELFKAYVDVTVFGKHK